MRALRLSARPQGAREMLTWWACFVKLLCCNKCTVYEQTYLCVKNHLKKIEDFQFGGLCSEIEFSYQIS